MSHTYSCNISMNSCLETVGRLFLLEIQPVEFYLKFACYGCTTLLTSVVSCGSYQDADGVSSNYAISH